MVIAVILVFIVVIFIQAQKIEGLQAKIYFLQKELKKYKNIVNSKEETEEKSCIEENKDSIEKSSEIIKEQNLENKVKNSVQENENVKINAVKVDKKECTHVDEKDSKNLTILITGSIFIVLAAIVFLTTAWKTIPDLMKTVVLFLVTFVFIGASKISKDRFHLEKASKTFFYVGMAYLPICLLSISVFGLFGQFLSVNGEGKYIYLFGSTAVLSLLYYLIFKTSKDKYIFYGSLLSQILSVILFSCMFEERLFLVTLNLLLYNLLLIIFTKGKDRIFELIINLIPLVITVCAIIGFSDDTWYYICTCLLLAINILYFELKQTHIIKSTAFNVALFVFGFKIIFKDSLGFTDGTCQVLATIYIAVIIMIENLLFSSLKDNKNLVVSSRIVTLIASGYIYIGSIMIQDAVFIPTYIIAILIEVLLVYYLKTSKQIFYKYLGYIFINFVLNDFAKFFFEESNIIDYIPMLTTSLIMCYEMYYSKVKDEILQIYLGFFEAISLIFLFKIGTEVSCILSILFTIYAVYCNKKIELNSIFNAIPIGFLLLNIKSSDLNEQFELGILLLSTLVLTVFSFSSSELNIFTILSASYLLVTCDLIQNDYLKELLLIIWGIAHIYFNKAEKRKDFFKVITIFFITLLYYSIIKDLKLLEYTIFKLFGIIIAGMYILKNIIKKYSEDIDTIEYIFWAIVYLFALQNYADSKDGIIFSILILSIIFLSFYKKYGATFLAGILALLVNGFVLTRTFWFSIPWWIYLLSIGGILIGFAVRNEAKENNEKISMSSVLKGIKDKVEK